jgi:HNH endonuclease
MGRRCKWTDEQLRCAVAENCSVRSVIRALGLRPCGGNYATIHRRIAELRLPTTHWLGQAHLRGKSHSYRPRRSLQDVLREGTRYQSFRLKKRLIEAGLMDAVCAGCGLTEWLGRPIPLELDHVDGNTENNRLENLRLICPNCHAFTPTYRGRNTKYAHIPPLQEIRDGIEAAGSVAQYAAQKGVSPDVVRGWLRPERLRRLSKVTERVAIYLH